MKTLNEITKSAGRPKQFKGRGDHYLDTLESKAREIIKTVNGTSDGYDQEDLERCGQLAQEMLDILKKH